MFFNSEENTAAVESSKELEGKILYFLFLFTLFKYAIQCSSDLSVSEQRQNYELNASLFLLNNNYCEFLLV